MASRDVLNLAIGSNDHRTIERLARTDADVEVRRDAVQRVRDEGILYEIATRDAAFVVRRAAIDRMQDVVALATIAWKGDDQHARDAARARLSDDTVFEYLARYHPDADVRCGALAAVVSEAVRMALAITASDSAVRAAAVRSLGDDALRFLIQDPTTPEAVCLAVLERVRPGVWLDQVAQFDKRPAVRVAAVPLVSDRRVLLALRNDRAAAVSAVAEARLKAEPEFRGGGRVGSDAGARKGAAPNADAEITKHGTFKPAPTLPGASVPPAASMPDDCADALPRTMERRIEQDGYEAMAAPDDVMAAPPGSGRARSAIADAIDAAATLATAARKSVGSRGRRWLNRVRATRLPPELVVAVASQRAVTESSTVAQDQVACSLFGPPEVARGDSIILQAFLHAPDVSDEVKELASEFDPTATGRGFRNLETAIKRGSRVTLHLDAPNLVVEKNPVQSVTWRGRTELVQFVITAPTDAPTSAIGKVTVSVESIPLGHVAFRLAVRDGAATAPTNADAIGHEARAYKLIFTSYASQDRAEVLKRLQLPLSMGMRIFTDLLSLEPGERWERELYKRIDECDLFLLFWSTAAKQSEWVERETKYALARKAHDEDAPPEILPVIIEGPPLVAPPPYLAHLHFNDRNLYFMRPAA